MIKFDKPINLNGEELLNELAANGVACNKPPFIDGEDNLWLDIKQADEPNATAVVAAHNGTTVSPEPTIEDKLASVGLSLPDLKAALGI
jgi:Ser/Thr protein kinase RdoA (MazF antagonist)